MWNWQRLTRFVKKTKKKKQNSKDKSVIKLMERLRQFATSLGFNGRYQ